MINQVNSQPMISCPQMNMPKQEAKNLIISPSLMMMLLEWASKLGDNDIALHQALENMMSFNDGINPLKIDCFEVIVPETVKAESNEVPEDWSDIEGGEVVQAFTDGFNIANQEEPCQDCPCATDEDISCANELGQCCAECGADLSNVPYSDVSTMIIQARDNEDLEDYGASNHEIESFWDGYESVDPQEIEYYDDEPKSVEQPIVQKDEEEISDDLQAEIEKIINLSAGN